MMLAGIVAVTAMLPATSVQAANERALYIHYTHTKETARIVFKRNGQYVREGLNQLNVFLRDWRRNEPANMDPALFDLLWEVYQETGSDQPIHVVSAYRSPATNAMLASNSSGVANNSQHMAGKAIDFFIPGVPVARIREIGFRKQTGGVGFYPNSGSPFVHLDTGSVRAWPRMTTAQLQQIFPDGRTLHIPSNGVPLSREGYQLAQADYQRCGRVNCSASSSSSSTQSASAGGNRTNLWDMITGNNNQTQQVAAAPQPAAAAAPANRTVTSVPVQQVAYAPPPPPVRPATVSVAAAEPVTAAPVEIPFAIVDADSIVEPVIEEPVVVAAIAAPMPPAMSRTVAELRAATPSTLSAEAGNAGTLAIAALDQQPPSRPEFAAPITATAYAAPNARIEAAPTAQPAPSPVLRPAITATPAVEVSAEETAARIAATTPQDGLEGFADLFAGPILPVDGRPDTATVNALATLGAREGELFAPDLDHVTDLFMDPASISSTRFASFTDPDNADFDPATALGGNTFTFSRTASVTSGTTGPSDNSIWVTLN